MVDDYRVRDTVYRVMWGKVLLTVQMNLFRW